jgi:cell division septum initiation protein DivIVA
MAQSEIRGNNSGAGSGGDIPEDADSGQPKRERETRTVTGHPESYTMRDRGSRAGAGDDDSGRDAERGGGRFQSNRVSPAERERSVKGAREVKFPVALRGYDRVAVDRYVREVNRLIAELEISSSPESAVRHALDEVSEETREILQRAHQSAEELTARSRAKADDRLQLAETEAQELRESSQREAEETRERAAAEATDTRERAAAEAAELRETVGAEAAEVRETAAAEAHELRETAAREAEQLRQTASQEAQRTRTVSQREADELRTTSRRDAEELIEDAETRARELSHSAEAIWRERRRLIEDMRGVGEQLVALGEAESKRFPRFPEDIAAALEPLRDRAPGDGEHAGAGEVAAPGEAAAPGAAAPSVPGDT